MLKIAIIGASGYTGAELSRILCSHQKVQISAVTSRQHAGQKLAEVFPHLNGKVTVTCEHPDLDQILKKADLFFTAVPHKTAMAIVPDLLSAGKKVIDLSADFRIKDVETYEKWYQMHTATDHLNDAVYGLPELYREDIKKTSLVANPGCYPTSVLLALAPLLENRIIEPASIIIDSKSGTSGAGRSAAVGTLFCEVTDGFRPYKVGAHRHTPEIEQEISILAGTKTTVSFTPHLLPISRGILSTIYTSFSGELTEEQVESAYQKKYHHEPFVRILSQNALPATQYVRGSNYCDISFRIDRRTNRLIIISAIDNIVKGAAGQAVQNMNIICGFPEQEGLEGAPFFP